MSSALHEARVKSIHFEVTFRGYGSGKCHHFGPQGPTESTENRKVPHSNFEESGIKCGSDKE